MKHVETAQQVLCSTVGKNAKKRALLSEHEVLEVQEYFLNPGYHWLVVDNKECGRKLMTDFLDVLHYNSRVAVLNTENWTREGSYDNLYRGLSDEDFLSEVGALEEFVAHSFDYDFLAIEGTKELLCAPWFGQFEKHLMDHEITSFIPIITFFYA